ncbi:dTDP-4-dehydrorhamnose reductase [Achromobacter sp. ACM03]|uniref:dTDP-4-dehydrorhamnose reductase n=1 Tax=Achromobacter TaxID=222 RepID=UPI000F73C153|nr:dTDP-4-dehydrorhamnose reductase [Achromobacter aegrifaciens]MBD9432242.1 dTDP-4-dehydrorhamnose reductase [Achromobacter sp. ACM03]MBD9475590.1 dTDP-4-dehydrorhamnose reductase [Achromobacter sp. ACM01]RSF04133.1 dTDP-4-dehydrorhamnose reductase [Achromobacter aegrifaciens]CAB3825899.1 dTDP-4-dehydrorhamnose reductase [Achromobacter aegrifaciens]
MKILLLGKDGQVGRELNHALLPLGEVVALGRDGADLRDPDALLAVLSFCRPDVIINAAAYTAVDAAESDRETAAQVNALAVATLARHAQAARALLVHFSTDYVFDGAQQRAYSETDRPNPLNVYGSTKLAGEQAIQATGCDALVFRIGWVHSWHGKNFLNSMLRLALERQSLNVVSDQHGTPTSAEFVADITAQAIRQHCAGQLPAGTYHLAAAGSTDWHAYARYIVAGAAARGASLMLVPDQIHAIAARDYPAAARRPSNSTLDTAKLSRALQLPMPSWTEQVDRTLDQLSQSGNPAFR